MKIKSLQISNILSFKHHDDIANAAKITFEDGLNIIIGENGSGKSTALEIINFLFKRVFNKQYNFNQDLYLRRNAIPANDRRQILLPGDNNTFNGFRLDPNWDTPNQPQIIRVEIKLDDIDAANIQNLKSNLDKIGPFISLYTTRGISAPSASGSVYTLDIALNRPNQNFSLTFVGGEKDFGFEYLSDYNFYKESILMYNIEHPDAQITPMYESFALISSYRNYHSFEKSISLRDQNPSQQFRGIRDLDYSKSMNAGDQSEPTVFWLVRLRVAEKHYDLISEKLTEAECEAEANKLPFITEINKRLKVVNLSCKIRLVDKRTWQYSFEFHDLRRNKILNDINSLSAGQKSIVHLVFEAYGRGDLKGGLVIIDEPEVHLHYQFQNEYLQVIYGLNKDQNCQYILVTHSEALINSTTINHVRRFSLNKEGNTEIKSPQLTADQRTLIRILDNTRSTYAFFAKKVLLTEGYTDRYLFKSILQEKHPNLDQEIAVLNIEGKENYNEWKNLFESFGLAVYFIADFDFIRGRFYSSAPSKSIKSLQEVSDFKSTYPDWEANIDSDYSNHVYILKNGDLEHYLGVQKKPTEVIDFCNNQLSTFLSDNTNLSSLEIRKIMDEIVS
ncbi:AAA family ATPase [Ferrovibrio terrae]|uniref:AAA family ATPase n=1 Tax=Ferrovibrio terrae TaxID=2594003 RepID=UPI0031379B23